MMKFISDFDGGLASDAGLLKILADSTPSSRLSLPFTRWEIIIGGDDMENSLSGFSAATLVDFMLCEIDMQTVENGSVFITSMFPAQDFVTSVLALLLNVHPSAVKVASLAVAFENEAARLHAVLSWCLACGWSFVFVSSTRKMFIAGDDYRLELGLEHCGAFLPTVATALVNVGFVELR